ncbi:hypothetical protein [Burkholderia contaminans]|uniref:hypothetical protein n=1 Tax=Burkholderia contaminans TaxID=488447 RepID=UPI003D66B05C
MATSEVAMAASAVATTAAQVPAVNGWTLVLSSAVVSALVNGAFKWWGDRTARRDEKAKVAEQRAPAQLDAALMLEAFARQAVGYLDTWDARFEDWLIEQHAGTQVEQRPWTPLTFDQSLVKDWASVPIEILSRCRELPVALTASNTWVSDNYNEWRDFADLHWLDSQRAILYGLQAGELATKIRAMIAAPASNLATDSFDRLQREFDEIKRRYEDAHGKLELMPDLKARLQRECPHVAPAPSPEPTPTPAGG